MVDNAPPSKNPANVDALTGAFQLILTKFLQNMDNMLPARVIKYNRTTNLAQVQPLIQLITTKNQLVSRAQIASVPVIQMGGGSFVMSFPMATGDLGWIHANDRDISLFLQAFAESPPNTVRKHSFSDAVLVPDTMMKGVTIAAEDAGNAVFQTKDGTVKIALWPTQIKVLAPNTAVTDTTAYAPNPNAVLDVQSTTKAFKICRMTHAQRDAIASPTGGMMVYVTDAPAGFSFYVDGMGWS